MDPSCQWIFLLIGGRDYISPQKAVYTWYISGIYQLDDYMLPTTFYKNQNNPLIMGLSWLSSVTTYLKKIGKTGKRKKEPSANNMPTSAKSHLLYIDLEI